MPRFAISRSVAIDAPPSACYACVRDFQQWPTWSPWLIAEPDCTMTYDPEGRGYTWAGSIVGAGEMKIESETEGARIDYTLTFLKPWKSTSAVAMQFRPIETGTKVTWTMKGSLPIFMFWMKRMMETFIGMDYRRGLLMLKDLIETGSVPSAVETPGVVEIDPVTYVGVPCTASVDTIGTEMQAALAQLTAWSQESGVVRAGPPLASYHKFQMSKGRFGFVVGFPVARVPADLPGPFVAGTIPACRAYAVQHTGPYRHLGNAWSVGMAHGRAKLFRQTKKIPPFERYDSDPATTPNAELRSTVLFPDS